MHIVVGGYGRAIQRGRLIMPAAEGGFDFFVDSMADSLHDFGFDYVALRIDGDLDDNVADEVARKLGAIDGRIGIDGREGDVHFMADDGSVDDAP